LLLFVFCPKKFLLAYSDSELLEAGRVAFQLSCVWLQTHKRTSW
jgi:hypothetical protein